jgi:hypothetical protein
MKIKAVTANGRKRAFEVETAKGTLTFPYSKADPTPCGQDPVVAVAPDRDFGDEAFTYQLRSGQEGSVHIDSVLEVNRDPTYMADLLLYKLSLTAKQQLAKHAEPVRDVAAALGTSPAQIYRLVDPTNYTKSFSQLIELLNYLGYDVDVSVSRKPSKHRRVDDQRTAAGASRKTSARVAVAASPRVR